VRQVAQQMLERCGLTVIIARDGAEALAAYREHGRDIALVLLDMTMPRMDGHETYRALRELDPDVRVLLASGYDEHDTSGPFAVPGHVGFIQKPFTMATLAARVRASLAATGEGAGPPDREGSTNDAPDPVE
jgi:CheY-like chemotaxis protein